MAARSKLINSLMGSALCLFDNVLVNWPSFSPEKDENSLPKLQNSFCVTCTAQEVFFSLYNPIMDKRDKNMSSYHNTPG